MLYIMFNFSLHIGFFFLFFFFFLRIRRPPRSTLVPYTPLFRSGPRTSGSTKTRHCSRSTPRPPDRKSTRLNSSHPSISYAVFCLKKKTEYQPENSSKTPSVQSRIRQKRSTAS